MCDEKKKPEGVVKGSDKKKKEKKLKKLSEETEESLWEQGLIKRSSDGKYIILG